MITKKIANEIGQKALEMANDEWHKKENDKENVEVHITFKETDSFKIWAYFGSHGASYCFSSRMVSVSSPLEKLGYGFEDLDSAYNFLKTTRRKAFTDYSDIDIKIHWMHTHEFDHDLELPETLTIKKIKTFASKR